MDKCLGDGAAAGAAPSTTAVDPFSNWLRELGPLGGTGVLLWYLWFDVTKVKPRMERLHQEQIEDLLKSHTDHIKEIEERHAAAWTLTTSTARADIDKLAAALAKLADATDRSTCRYATGSPE